MGCTRKTPDDALYAKRHAAYLKRRSRILSVAKETYQRQKEAKKAALRAVTARSREERLRERRRRMYGDRMDSMPPLHGSTKIWVQELKGSTPCLDCGHVFHFCQMDFDHVRGVKHRDVSELVDTASLNAIKIEIAKCDLVCANCHRLRTFHRR